jgi:hypothetical protein
MKKTAISFDRPRADPVRSMVNAVDDPCPGALVVRPGTGPVKSSHEMARLTTGKPASPVSVPPSIGSGENHRGPQGQAHLRGRPIPQGGRREAGLVRQVFARTPALSSSAGT